jgi:hypothetical protein
VSVRRGLANVLVVLAGVAVVATSAAAPDRRPPRIVSALMQDADRDARADSVRLTYSMRIRHARDRDGRYPFAVVGYRIRSVGTASGKALVILLVEKAQPDPAARPAVRYRWTSSKPVADRAGTQAVAQLFRGARAHRRTPPPTTPTTTTTTTPTTPQATPPAPADADRDGYLDERDCAPKDPTIHPGAPDLPDLTFVDSNCDGIDGTEQDAIFASPEGDDTNPGTKEKPKRQINAAISAAQLGGKYVLAAAGSYARASAGSGIDIYGGYDPGDWSRKTGSTTQIAGTGHGFFADAATDVTLQLLSVRAVNDGASAYGIRAINGSSLRLQRVTVSVGDGAPGAPGANGEPGLPGSPGFPGLKGACDSNVTALGGGGGESPVGRDGGEGGDGKYESGGRDGEMGLVGTPGGKGGVVVVNFSSGYDRWGKPGANGTSGAPGAAGAGGTNSTGSDSATWQGRGGIEGIYGAPGNGGGGGGAGGGQTGAFVVNGTGNGGGGGGGGGAGGRGGGGGGAGSGSFGVYLYSSTLVAEKSTITAGNGGEGGRGGNGGPGGTGGGGGEGYFYCNNEIGQGGNGGRGGNGGPGGGGGGGAGGPSIGIFKVGAATANLTLTDTKVNAGSAGPGGATGSGGTAATPSQAGIEQAIYP